MTDHAMTGAGKPITPHRAMVLAAGLGTRMRPLTDHQPKPLITVAGKALIDFALDRFDAAGVARAIVNVHYFADQMETHIKGRSEQGRGPDIAISDERALLLETGGGLKKAWGLLGDDPVFCTNTDAILIDGDGADPCQRLRNAWNPETMDALLLLVPPTATSGYDGKGDFDIAGDDESGGVSSGPLAWRTGATAEFVFTGLQIIKTSLLHDTPDGPFSTKILWEKAAAQGRLHGIVHDGRWMHVGDPEGLAAAEAWFSANP